MYVSMYDVCHNVIQIPSLSLYNGITPGSLKWELGSFKSMQMQPFLFYDFGNINSPPMLHKHTWKLAITMTERHKRNVRKLIRDVASGRKQQEMTSRLSQNVSKLLRSKATCSISTYTKKSPPQQGPFNFMHQLDDNVSLSQFSTVYLNFFKHPKKPQKPLPNNSCQSIYHFPQQYRQ